MTKTMSAALVALALAGGTLAIAPAKADSVTTTTETTSTTGPVFGYNDGYWDRGHAWHAWANHDAAVTYSREHHEHYYNSAHTAAPDMGWRSHDMYWETH